MLIGVARGGRRGHALPKFLENIVILCFERCFSIQNSVIRLKSYILAPQIFGLATPLAMHCRCVNKNFKSEFDAISDKFGGIFHQHLNPCDKSLLLCWFLKLNISKIFF